MLTVVRATSCLLLLLVKLAALADTIAVSPSTPHDSDSITFFGTYQNPGWTFDGVTASVDGNEISVTWKQTGSIGTLASDDPYSVTIPPLPAGTYTVTLYGQVRQTAQASYGTPAFRAGPVVFSVTALAPPMREAVEFFHGGLRHYFVTAQPEETNSLIDHPELGWSLTGQSFKVFDRASTAGYLVEVCRFYGSISPGPNSHFYTAQADECEFLKTLQSQTPANLPRWNFEELAFKVGLPTSNDDCPASMPLKVYRVYNGRALQNDSNHRYVTTQSAYAAMVSSGWLPEGVAMCVPN